MVDFPLRFALAKGYLVFNLYGFAQLHVTELKGI